MYTRRVASYIHTCIASLQYAAPLWVRCVLQARPRQNGWSLEGARYVSRIDRCMYWLADRWLVMSSSSLLSGHIASNSLLRCWPAGARSVWLNCECIVRRLSTSYCCFCYARFEEGIRRTNGCRCHRGQVERASSFSSFWSHHHQHAVTSPGLVADWFEWLVLLCWWCTVKNYSLTYASHLTCTSSVSVASLAV